MFGPRKWCFLALPAILFSSAGVYLLGAKVWRSPPPIYAIGHLAVAAESLDFGEVWEDRNFVWRMPIRNCSHSDVQIQDISISCGCCTDVRPRSLTIPAGRTELVALTLDSSRRTTAELGRAERPFAVEVIPLLDRTRRPGQPGWVLHGTVKSRVTTDLLSLQFGDRPTRGRSPVTRKVVATVHSPTGRLEATIDPKVASVEVRPRGDGTDVFEVVVTPLPSLPPGPFQTHLALNLVTSNGERNTGVTLPVEGMMQAEVRPIPARVVFGSKPLGEIADATVVMQAPPGAELSVERMEADSPDVQIEAVEAAEVPAGRAFRVTQRVSKVGEQMSAVRWSVRLPGGELLVVPIEVSYRGEEPPATSTEKDTRDIP